MRKPAYLRSRDKTFPIRVPCEEGEYPEIYEFKGRAIRIIAGVALSGKPVYYRQKEKDE